MIPVQVGLKPDHGAVADRDDRLVAQLELLALERRAQVALKLEPAIQLGAQRSVKDREAVASRRLGFIHRDVGLVDQAGCRVGRAVRGTESDARRYRDQAGAEVDRVVKRCECAAGYRHRLQLLAERFDENPELVSAQAGDDVVGTNGHAQPLCHLRDQAIAGLVADAVVDLLELIDVDEQDAQ